MGNKIVFFLPTLNGGGAERVTINIIKQLNHDEHEIHLVLLQETGDFLQLIPDKVTVHNLNIKKTMYSIIKLRKYLQVLNPNTIYSTLYRSHIAIYLALKYTNLKPKIICRIPNSPKLVLEKNELSRTMKFFLELALKNATIIIAQTPQMKDEIIKYHNVIKEKIQVMINPLDVNNIESSILINTNPFDKNYINVLASGRILPQKGYDILIKAFHKVYASNPNYRLHIIGSNYGNFQQKYQQLIDELNLNGIITFLGFQQNPYIYYKNADLFVQSSRWEGLPNTILENLYLRKPIVATNCIPYMETLIQDGENGLLVEVDNPYKLSEGILKHTTLTKLGNRSSTSNFNINKIFKSKSSANLITVST